MSGIRHGVELLCYHFDEDEISVGVRYFTDVFLNKMYDLEESAGFYIEVEQAPHANGIFDNSGATLVITGSLAAFDRFIFAERPYEDDEITSLVDSLSVILEQFPAKLRMIADSMER